jgi:hypothetical protein
MALRPDKPIKSLTINYTEPAPGQPQRVQVFNDPGGDSSQIQYNVNGKFVGSPNFQWNEANRTLSILGNIRVTGNITGTYRTNSTNFKILGGNVGDVLATDGTGNLTWQSFETSVYGNANVASFLPTYQGLLTGGGVASISNTAPTANIQGKIWFNTDEGRTFVSYNNQWVDSSPVATPDPNLEAESITFTDGRVQTTVNQQRTTPVSSIGNPGDKLGDTAVDNTYFYYCFANYNGVSNIWRRTEWTGTSW